MSRCSGKNSRCGAGRACYVQPRTQFPPIFSYILFLAFVFLFLEFQLEILGLSCLTIFFFMCSFICSGSGWIPWVCYSVHYFSSALFHVFLSGCSTVEFTTRGFIFKYCFLIWDPSSLWCAHFLKSHSPYFLEHQTAHLFQVVTFPLFVLILPCPLLSRIFYRLDDSSCLLISVCSRKDSEDFHWPVVPVKMNFDK